MLYFFCISHPWRCPVRLPRSFQYVWKKFHRGNLCYVPRKTPHPRQRLLWPGNFCHSEIFLRRFTTRSHFANVLWTQIIGTAALIVCILAIVDPYNNPIPQGLEAFTVGFVVLVIGLSMGFNSGYAVNPARDLGPRIFTAMAGWGGEVFT